jgi:hypothetical protein
MEGAMPKVKLWNNAVPRVELDQRARDARLRLERLERLLVPHHVVAASWLRKVLFRFSFGTFGGRARGNQTEGPLSSRRSPRMPRIRQVCPETCDILCRAS